MRFTFRKIAYAVLGLYFLVTCYTGFVLFRRRLYTAYTTNKERIILEKIQSLRASLKWTKLHVAVFSVHSQMSNLLNQARLRVLKAREDHIKSVLEECSKRLGRVTEDKAKYQKVLEGLISQGLFQLLETNVTIRCREVDRDVVQAAIPSAVNSYKTATKGRDTKVTVDTDNYLPSDIAGGVELISQSKFKVENTLDSRLDLISQQMLPELREILFGKNPNRRFMD